jgi:hypothetical protein
LGFLQLLFKGVFKIFIRKRADNSFGEEINYDDMKSRRICGKNGLDAFQIGGKWQNA